MRHGLSLFLSSDVDIIFLPWSFYYQNNNKVKNILSFSSSKVIERPKEDNKKITSFVCAKIIKSSIIKNTLLFSTDMVTGEDSLFMTEAYFIKELAFLITEFIIIRKIEKGRLQIKLL